MEIRIGVLHIPKELKLDYDGSVDDVTKVFDDALQGGDAVVWLTDVKGRRIGVPAQQLAYIEIEAGHDGQRVGFGPS